MRGRESLYDHRQRTGREVSSRTLVTQGPDLPADPARQDAIERATRIADRLRASGNPLLQQFGEHMRETVTQAGDTTPTAEIEEVIETVTRLGQGYGVDLDDLQADHP
jgi:hypothetical protein